MQPSSAIVPCLSTRLELPKPQDQGLFSRRACDLYQRQQRLIEQDLHDGVVQYLSAALLYFEASCAPSVADSQTGKTHWKRGMDLLSRSITEVRRLIQGLQPEELDGCGLVSAVSELVESHRCNFGLQIKFQHKVCFDRLFPLLETSLFRMIQESLENARRHSQSTRIDIKLIQRAQRIHVEVRDWGVGFDPANIDRSRLGVRGILNRAEILGGRAAIHSSPGAGTRIIVDIPIVGVQAV